MAGSKYLVNPSVFGMADRRSEAQRYIKMLFYFVNVQFDYFITCDTYVSQGPLSLFFAWFFVISFLIYYQSGLFVCSRLTFSSPTL